MYVCMYVLTTAVFGSSSLYTAREKLTGLGVLRKMHLVFTFLARLLDNAAATPSHLDRTATSRFVLSMQTLEPEDIK